MPQVRVGKKRNFHRLDALPFPNYELSSIELPFICRCIYDGAEFYVSRANDMHTLYKNGSFGISNVTKRGPKEAFEEEPIVRRTRAENHMNKLKEIYNNDDDSGNAVSAPKILKKDSMNEDGNKKEKDVNEESNHEGAEVEVKVNGNGASEVEDENHIVEEADIVYISPKKDVVEEKLILLPEEVIFLSFGIGCLSIQTLNGDPMTFQEVWKESVQKNSDFPILYAVYHYFRAKNWVPKCGAQFGGNYVLYQSGPEICHSSYIVHILGFRSRERPSWRDLYGWQRVSTNAGKVPLICDVKLPEEFLPEDSTPKSIFTMNIDETTFNRWT